MDMWNKLFKSKSKQNQKKGSKLSDVVKNLTCKRVPKDKDNVVDNKTKLEFLVGGACRFLISLSISNFQNDLCVKPTR